MGKVIARKIQRMSLMAKISLTMILTMLFLALLYQGWYKPRGVDSAPLANGRIVYSIGTTTPQSRSYDVTSNTFAAAGAMQTGVAQTWMVNKAAPARNENIAGYVTATGVLYIQRWNGSAWSAEWNVTVGGNGVDGRRFDIVYENLSGDAMVVYSTNAATTNELAYRVWNGTSWTAATNLDPARVAQAVSWIKLVAKPGSDEITLGAQSIGTTAGNDSDLTVMTWTGAAWGNEPAAAVSSLMQNSTTPQVQIEGFDIAYESTSGDRLIAYTQPGTTAGIYYRTYNTGGNALGTATSLAAYTSPGIPVLRADPNSNEILVLFSRNASTSIYGRIWDGAALGASTTIDTGSVTPAVEKRQINGEWLIFGGKSYPVVFWTDSASATTLNYRVCTDTATPTWATAGTYTVVAAPQFIDLEVDPRSPDTLMLIYSDSASDLFAKQVIIDGAGALTFTDAGSGTFLTNALGSITSQNFSFAYDRIIPPSLSLPTVSAITTTGATLGATVDTIGSGTLSARGTVWNTTAAPTTNQLAEGGTIVGAYSHARTGFTAGTKYFYRGYATNSVGLTRYSADGSFYTAPTAATIGAFTGVSATGLTVNWTRGGGDGVIVVLKPSTATLAAPVNGTYTGYSANAAFGSGTELGTGNFVVYKSTGTSVAVTGLNPNTTYNAYVYEYKNAQDTVGNDMGVTYSPSPATGNQLTSMPPLPTVASPTASAITDTTAMLGANVTAALGLTARGTLWGTTATPAGNILAEGGMLTGAYSHNRTSLPPDTKIYYRGYATNATGTGYSPDGSFYTEPATQASAVTFPVAGATSMTVTWTRGSGEGVIVLMRAGSAVNADPADGNYSGYTANAVFGSGTQVGTGNYVIYKGTGSSVNVTGLTNTTTYYVSVYEYRGALDTAGVNLGVNYKVPALQAYQGTVASQPSATASCAGCHGYTAYYVDGATRNNPVGSFVGSHNKHVIVYPNPCADCHVIPATTTSADYDHQNGLIDMRNPLNGDTGASYGKGASWTQTNTPTTMQTCSNTYCHSTGVSVATGTVPANTSVTWGGTTYCNSCHGIGGPASGITAGAPNYSRLLSMPTAQAGATWTNPANALTDNRTFASYAGTAAGTLILTNFGYTTAQVADSDTVTGITVIVRGWAASATTPGNQLNVQLTQNGTAGVGTGKAISLPGTTLTANADVYATTTVTDLWGTTWTPAQIRATSFGVILKDNDATSSQLNVDSVKVIVHTNRSPKMTNHSSAYGHRAVTCNICHTSVSYSGGVYTPNGTLHTNGSYNVQAAMTYTFVASGGTCGTPGNGCHGPTVGKWGGVLGCVDCHNKTITRVYGRPGTTLANVVGEFGLAWGHKKSGRNAVSDDDCCVCHLEGDGISHKASAYHQNGNIDLRDPDGAGETPITNISGGAFTFQRFTTSYVSLSRTSTGHTANTVDNVITQKFCMACHDSNGAINPRALSNNGGTATATRPFGGIDLGADYSVVNGAAAANSMVDVKTQFAVTNSSKHPVLGPLNRDFATADRLTVPYKPTGTRGTGGTLSLGVVINCFDCHNVVGTPLTRRTVTAHGNAVTIRGVATTSGQPSSLQTTFCVVCHAGYNNFATNGSSHGAGSAFSTNVNQPPMDAYLNYACNICHGSNYATAVVRPVRAQDVHGVNALPAGGVAKSDRWAGNSVGTPAQVDARPYAFMRNTNVLSNHTPKKIGGTTYTSNCNMASGTCNQGVGNYTVGGTY